MVSLDNKYIEVSNTISIDFQTPTDGSMPKATLDIKNTQANSNIAYKVKTTAPKLFVVKPI